MRRSLFSFSVLLMVVAAGCQCGDMPSSLCEQIYCSRSRGLVCDEATGRCVSANPGDAGVEVGDAGTDAGVDAGTCAMACTGATPVCNPATLECATCASSNDCPMATPYCVTTFVATGECFGCRSAVDCGLALCDSVTHTCLAPPDAGPLNDAVVYGHTATTLFKIDATTKVVTTVADFHNCGSAVIDLALDQFSRAFVTTYAGLFRVDLQTGNCTLIGTSALYAYPNALSFVPRGTVDPSVEALVGFNGSDYLRINPVTGAIQALGTLGGGFESSGDLVSVINGNTYLTAKNFSLGPGNDYLLQVDPANGALIRNLGPLPYIDVFGLAFWGGSLYGFSNAGTLFEITLNGSGTTSAPVPNASRQIWNGAGSTTAAALR